MGLGHTAPAFFKRCIMAEFVDPLNPDLKVGVRIRFDDMGDGVIDTGTIVRVGPGEINVQVDGGELEEGIDTTPLQSRVFTVLDEEGK